MAQQLKKLLYNKRLVDTGTGEEIAEWKISTWKVFFALIAVAVALIVVYGLLFIPEGESGDFFGNMVFYSIILIVVIAVLWITATTTLKFRQLITGFIIAFILILVFYWFLGFLLGHFDILQFHMGGPTLYVLISILALMGARRIDNSLDRNDLAYGFLVFLLLLGSNLPIVGGKGFLYNVDNLLATIWNFIPW